MSNTHLPEFSTVAISIDPTDLNKIRRNSSDPFADKPDLGNKTPIRPFLFEVSAQNRHKKAL